MPVDSADAVNALALDTATTSLGLCLQAGGKRRTATLEIGLKHSERLMPEVARLLADAGLEAAELDLIVCSTGPGSFTGIRIGLAAAKGLAAGIEGRGGRCRLLGISTLDGLARRFRLFRGVVAAVNPSLRRNFYAALYRNGKRDGEYLETTIPRLAEALARERTVLLTGGAALTLYRELRDAGAGGQLGGQLVPDTAELSTDPAGLLQCGLEELERLGKQGSAPAEPAPLYLRKSEAEISLFRRHPDR